MREDGKRIQKGDIMIDRRKLNDDAACMANALKAIWSHYEEESLKECLNKD